MLLAVIKYRIAMLLLLYFTMAYQGSYESTFSELMKEVINEEFNSQQ